MKELKEISTRLEIAKKKISNSQKKDGGSNAASFGKALKISTELVAAVVVGSTMSDPTTGRTVAVVAVIWFMYLSDR